MGNKFSRFRRQSPPKEKKEKKPGRSYEEVEVNNGPVQPVAPAPRPPPEPLPSPTASNKIRVRALFSYTPINDDDLAFKKGDLMELDENVDDTVGWWPATHLQTKETGFIPYNYVAIDDGKPETQDWWFSGDRNHADKILLRPGVKQGTFLVRSAKIGGYALSVRLNGQDGAPISKHFQIRKLVDCEGFYIAAKFSAHTVPQLIEHYMTNNALGGVCLTDTYPRAPPAVSFKNLEIKRSMVKLGDKLGAGCFGEVRKGTLHKVLKIAVKTLKTGGSPMSAEEFLKEAQIMHKLSHPNLVQLMGVVTSEEPFWIITELMVNGSLLDFLRKDENESLKLTSLLDIVKQISDGMAYLEDKNFIHRDLRAANVLVGENLEVKVADFGLSKIVDPDEEDIYVGNENTKYPVKWTAPEAAQYHNFSIKSDVWSFGVLMYEVITFGRTPYPGMQNTEVLQQLKRGWRMDKPTSKGLEVPDYYYEMMLRCWHQEPESRPSFHNLNEEFETLLADAEED